MKEYIFDITVNVGLNVGADSEKEARGKLTEELQEYFAETTIEISKKEAKLLYTQEL